MTSHNWLNYSTDVHKLIIKNWLNYSTDLDKFITHPDFYLSRDWNLYTISEKTYAKLFSKICNENMFNDVIYEFFEKLDKENMESGTCLRKIVWTEKNTYFLNISKYNWIDRFLVPNIEAWNFECLKLNGVFKN